MKYIFLAFMLGCGYYTLTYGIYLFRKERNKLGGSAMVMLAIVGTLIPAFVMLIKS
jgi:hypothetical protein